MYKGSLSRVISYLIFFSVGVSGASAIHAEEKQNPFLKLRDALNNTAKKLNDSIKNANTKNNQNSQPATQNTTQDERGNVTATATETSTKTHEVDVASDSTPAQQVAATTPTHQAQQDLKKLGYYKGAIDGSMGNVTRQALILYTSQRGLIFQQLTPELVELIHLDATDPASGKKKLAEMKAPKKKPVAATPVVEANSGASTYRSGNISDALILDEQRLATKAPPKNGQWHDIYGIRLGMTHDEVIRVLHKRHPTLTTLNTKHDRDNINRRARGELVLPTLVWSTTECVNDLIAGKAVKYRKRIDGDHNCILNAKFAVDMGEGSFHVVDIGYTELPPYNGQVHVVAVSFHLTTKKGEVFDQYTFLESRYGKKTWGLHSEYITYIPTPVAQVPYAMMHVRPYSSKNVTSFQVGMGPTNARSQDYEKVRANYVQAERDKLKVAPEQAEDPF